MVKVIMNGCNGHMGQVITGIIANDPEAEIVAGIDVHDEGKNSYRWRRTLSLTFLRQRRLTL